MGCLSFSLRCEKDEMEGDAKSILENLKLSSSLNLFLNDGHGWAKGNQKYLCTPRINTCFVIQS